MDGRKLIKYRMVELCERKARRDISSMAVNSPILSLLYKLEIARWKFDLSMKQYMEGRLLDIDIAGERDKLDELENEFKNLVLSLEEENRRLKGL
jgi:hypothetical protein